MSDRSYVFNFRPSTPVPPSYGTHDRLLVKEGVLPGEFGPFQHRKGGFLSLFLLLMAAIALTPMQLYDFILPFHQKGFRPIVSSPSSSAPASSEPLILQDSFVSDHIQKTLAYIYQNIDPATYLAYSLPGDKRLLYWSVIYDDAMRSIAHIYTGDIKMAKKTLDYFMNNSAIQKVGWVMKNGKLVKREGWTINIVDASLSRAGGRGVEHVAHAGPNAYLGIAACHLYKATGERKYLEFARNRWSLIKDLQNEDANDPNFGGIRMGPMGDPTNPQEQRLNFNKNMPSYYEQYNGEHAADFKALCNLLTELDPRNREQYRQASSLIEIWDQKIYDKKNHLFYIGTTEKRYFEENIGRWVGPGVIDIHPLDTSALKLSAYGVSEMEIFEKDAAEKIRHAIDQNFLVGVASYLNGHWTTLRGYDFVTNQDRKRLILYEEEGPNGDIKVNKGVGRDPLLSDEWSTWVAFADLKMAQDFLKMGNKSKAAFYYQTYFNNACIEGIKSGDEINSRTIAYPYVHPISAGFNKPVGFGWNTHHEPYSMIGGVARILGLLRVDPFHLDGSSYHLDLPYRKFPHVTEKPAPQITGLVTEAELYVNKAWNFVALARQNRTTRAINMQKAIDIIDHMEIDHPDWPVLADRQNKVAGTSDDPFPLKGVNNLRITEMEAVYRKYWALYHVGTAEFIRALAYHDLAQLAKSNKDTVNKLAFEMKARSAAYKVLTNYYYCQAYDPAGFLWQPINSLKEMFPDFTSPEAPQRS